MLSLAYSFISLAFQMNFSGGVPNTGDGTQVTPTVDGYKNANAYGHGAFPVYWMLNFFGTFDFSRAGRMIADYVCYRNDRIGPCLRERGHARWTAMVSTIIPLQAARKKLT